MPWKVFFPILTTIVPASAVAQREAKAGTIEVSYYINTVYILYPLNWVSPWLVVMICRAKRSLLLLAVLIIPRYIIS